MSSGCNRFDARASCASLSNLRSRSICFRKLTGSSRSSLNDARSRSPIFLTIARLCRESMLTEFGILSFPRTRHQGQFATNGDRRLWLSARALVFEQRVRGTFGYPRHAPFVKRRATVSPIPSVGEDVRSRSLNICSDYWWTRRSGTLQRQRRHPLLNGSKPVQRDSGV